MATLTFRTTIVNIEPGRDVLGLLLDAGMDVSYLCMAGSCGTCAMRVLVGAEHLEEMPAAEKMRFLVRDGSRRLSCQAICRGSGDIVVAQP